MILVFDVDGTLLDSYPVVEKTYIDLFRIHLPNYQYTKKELLSFFGPPLYDTFYTITGNEEQSRKLVDQYRAISKVNTPLLMRAYPGVRETLTELKKEGYILAALSNKIKEAIVEGLRVSDLDGLLDCIVGYEDMTYPKPHPGGLEKIMALYQDQAIMIGDSVIDIKTAQRANCPSIGITWALTSAQEFKQAKATYVIDDIKEVITCIRSR